MKTQLSSSVKTNPTLYTQDYYLWLENTANLLKNGKLAEVDIANLIEEIEDMGKSEKRAVESNLEILLMHLLKYKYQPENQPEKRSNSWRYTIFEHRDRLEKSFRDSPSLKNSLKNYFAEIYSQCYSKARKKAAIETGLNISIFPDNSPFTPAETLNPDYLP